jgi:aspartate/methionine/tyrosine aminotransferase
VSFQNFDLELYESLYEHRVEYNLIDKPSYKVAEAIRQRASVLVAPGSSLGSEGYLQITLGYPTD